MAPLKKDILHFKFPNDLLLQLQALHAAESLTIKAVLATTENHDIELHCCKSKLWTEIYLQGDKYPNGSLPWKISVESVDITPFVQCLASDGVQASSGTQQDNDGPTSTPSAAHSGGLSHVDNTGDRLTEEDVEMLTSLASDWKCFVCGLTVARPRRGFVKRHLTTRHSVNLSKYDSVLTRGSVSEVLAGLRELKTVSSKDPPKRRGKQRMEDEPKANCLPCGEEFTQEELLESHKHKMREAKENTIAQPQVDVDGDLRCESNEVAGSCVFGRRCHVSSELGASPGVVGATTPGEVRTRRQLMAKSLALKGRFGSRSAAAERRIAQGVTNLRAKKGVTRPITTRARGVSKRQGGADNGIKISGVQSVSRTQRSTKATKRIKVTKDKPEKAVGITETTEKNSGVEGEEKIDDDDLVINDKTAEGMSGSTVCLICGKSVRKHLTHHVRRFHLTSTERYEEMEQATVEKRLEMAEEILRNQEEKKQRSSLGFTCPECGILFRNFTQASAHVLKQHRDVAQYDQLLLTLDAERYIRLSAGRPTDDLDIECSYCKSQRHGREIYTHMKFCHSEESDFQKAVDAVDFLIEEHRVTTRRRRYREYQMKTSEHHCMHCARAFRHYSSKARHQATCYQNPDRVQRFRCLVCDRIFMSESDLERHSESHLDKNYMCHLCGRTYKNKSGLSVHKRCTHNLAVKYEIKYHSCKHCGKQFYGLSKWRKHMLSHTEERLSVCELCGKNFKSDADVRKHKRTVHENHYRFYCKRCGHGVSSMRYLKNHVCGRVRRVQPQEDAPSVPAVGPSAVAVDPSAVAVGPSAVAVDPSAVAVGPSAVAVDPSAVVVDPSATAVGPSAVVVDNRAVAADASVVAVNASAAELAVGEFVKGTSSPTIGGGLRHVDAAAEVPGLYDSGGQRVSAHAREAGRDGAIAFAVGPISRAAGDAIGLQAMNTSSPMSTQPNLPAGLVLAGVAMTTATGVVGAPGPGVSAPASAGPVGYGTRDALLAAPFHAVMTSVSQASFGAMMTSTAGSFPPRAHMDPADDSGLVTCAADLAGVMGQIQRPLQGSLPVTVAGIHSQPFLISTRDQNVAVNVSHELLVPQQPHVTVSHMTSLASQHQPQILQQMAPPVSQHGGTASATPGATPPSMFLLPSAALLLSRPQQTASSTPRPLLQQHSTHITSAAPPTPATLSSYVPRGGAAPYLTGGRLPPITLAASRWPMPVATAGLTEGNGVPGLTSALSHQQTSQSQLARASHYDVPYQGQL